MRARSWRTSNPCYKVWAWGLNWEKLLPVKIVPLCHCQGSLGSCSLQNDYLWLRFLTFLTNVPCDGVLWLCHCSRVCSFLGSGSQLMTLSRASLTEQSVITWEPQFLPFRAPLRLPVTLCERFFWLNAAETSPDLDWQILAWAKKQSWVGLLRWGRWFLLVSLFTQCWRCKLAEEQADENKDSELPACVCPYFQGQTQTLSPGAASLLQDKWAVEVSWFWNPSK